MMETATVRRGREGSRWINERPTSQEVAEWFRTVPLHDGMDHEKYVGGITLIQGVEKADEIVGYDGDGRPVIVEDVRNVTFTPYMKVETRVAYFHDYVDHLGADDRYAEVGTVPIIEPITPVGGEALGLPPGFFAYRASGPKGEVKFIGCSYRVAIVERPKFVESGIAGRRVMEAIPILEGRGTKVVPTSTRYDVDLNAVMKAETGAIGRALGVAGILVLPGSGIATAEDMLEAMAPAPAATPEGATLPGEDVTAPLNDDELRQRATALLEEFEAFPEAAAKFRDWAKGRGHVTLNSLNSPALKGFVRKLERDLDAARSAADA
jgi:hypothetical protein